MPIPWQQLVEPLNRMLGDASENVGEPGLRIDVVELGGGDQGVDGRGAPAALIGRGLIVPGVRRAKSWSGIHFTH